MRQWSHTKAAIFAPESSPRLSMIATKKEDSILWDCLVSHKYFYYPAAVRKELVNTLYLEQLRIPLLLVIVSY